jgi:hypothetical protein
METITALTKEIEGRALELGARPAAIYKWRRRGIPYKWQLKLLSTYDDIKLHDLSAKWPTSPQETGDAQ